MWLFLIVVFLATPLAYAAPCMMKMPLEKVDCHHSLSGKTTAKSSCRIVADCFKQVATTSDAVTVSHLVPQPDVPVILHDTFADIPLTVAPVAQAPPQGTNIIHFDTHQFLATLSRWLI